MIYKIPLKTNPKEGICISLYCRKKPSKGRGGFCNTCYTTNRKHIAPLKYCYNFHRNNAKRDGKGFKLTFTEFAYFWLVVHPDKWELKKKNLLDSSSKKIKNRTCDYEMDRYDEGGDYELSNIICSTKKFNVSREHNYRNDPEYNPDDDPGLPDNVKLIVELKDELVLLQIIKEKTNLQINEF